MEIWIAKLIGQQTHINICYEGWTSHQTECDDNDSLCCIFDSEDFNMNSRRWRLPDGEKEEKQSLHRFYADNKMGYKIVVLKTSLSRRMKKRSPIDSHFCFSLIKNTFIKNPILRLHDWWPMNLLAVSLFLASL